MSDLSDESATNPLDIGPADGSVAPASKVKSKTRSKKSPTKKVTAKKAPTKKTRSKKASSKKAPPKKAPTGKANAKNSPAKKSGPQSSDPKKSAAKPSKPAEAGGAMVGGLTKEDRVFLKALVQPSNREGLKQITIHGGFTLAFLTVAAAFWGHWAYWPLAFIGGTLMTFLFAPLHETIHRTAFKSRRLNDGFASIIGFLLILPPQYFRAFHLEHHRYTQIEGKDPELAGKGFSTRLGYLWQISGIRTWAALIRSLTLHAFGRVEETYITGKTADRIKHEAALYLGLYAGLATMALLFGRLEPLIYWVIPALLGQPMLRLFLLAEHVGCPLEADMFENTRTTATNPIIRFFAWNMPYHVEHHAFMAVPYYNLPRAHRHFKDRIKVLSPGYINFHKKLLKSL